VPVLYCKGPSIKDVRIQGGRAVIQMRTSALFDAKNVGFFETHGVSAWTRGGGSSQ